jgi:hypothetical protein
MERDFVGGGVVNEERKTVKELHKFYTGEKGEQIPIPPEEEQIGALQHEQNQERNHEYEEMKFEPLPAEPTSAPDLTTSSQIHKFPFGLEQTAFEVILIIIYKFIIHYSYFLVFSFFL